ncbi:laminin subunit alpha-2-like [Cydia pomonella]|uniref:laminin subunit alpha-2-like n=1 Tax=Cydia pomonella TaxID=82600 RepID=UPI002ADE52B4|nr:laminin subunit alpha-2-like [Cydia pomonella]
MRLLLCLLLVVAVAGKGKKHRHNKPGRAVLDRLSSTTVTDGTVEPGRELLPEPLDVAPFAVVEANATCGDNGAEDYCRDTPGKRGVVCDVCEGLDGPAARRHPASYAIDGDPSTWWQSPVGVAHVTLVATLPDEMELVHVIIKSGPSPRPLAWSLEVSSSENEDWKMISAFGDKEHCRKLWDLRPERRRRKVRAVKNRRSDKPTCSTQFTSPRPLENGEMHIRVQEVAAQRVRISFRAAHPASPSQYYTVRALALVARCLCHAHARHCHVDRNVSCKLLASVWSSLSYD